MSLIQTIGRVLDRLLWRPIIQCSYRAECAQGWYEIKTFWLWQKVFRINGDVPWMVHPSSRVIGWEKIRMKVRCDPGASPGCYIQAGNGIELGKKILIGPNVGIISANHNLADRSTWDPAPPIRIGDNVWIGMNSVILPGVTIGDNAVIGAGSIVTKDIPSGYVAAGNPCRALRQL